MFCSHCGAKGEGNFCSACGRCLTTAIVAAPLLAVPVIPAPTDPLSRDDEPSIILATLADAPSGPPPLPQWISWQDEVRYDVLLQYSEVRDLIARHAARAKKPISAETIMELYDKVMKPFNGGVSIATVAKIALPIYSHLGIKTGKTRCEQFRDPAGKVLVTALCSLARHGWQLQHVHQADDGCVLEAELPSDFRSMGGDLIVTVHRKNQATGVQANTKIPGQLFDWGKSTRCLAELFDDLRSMPLDVAA